MREQDQIICEALNDILQFLYDSHVYLYRHISNTKNPKMKNMFHELSESRKSMIYEIKHFLNQYQYHPEVKGTWLGKTYMIFENLKAVLMRENLATITKEIIKNEDILLGYYQKALSLNLPEPLRKTLIEHVEQITEDMKTAEVEGVT